MSAVRIRKVPTHSKKKINLVNCDTWSIHFYKQNRCWFILHSENKRRKSWLIITEAVSRYRLIMPGSSVAVPQAVAAKHSYVLRPWYKSGQVMRPERSDLKCTREARRVPKVSAGGPSWLRPTWFGLRTGRRVGAGHGFGQVYHGRPGKEWSTGPATGCGLSPRRQSMGLPATKAQRSARAYHTPCNLISRSLTTTDHVIVTFSGSQTVQMANCDFSHRD